MRHIITHDVQGLATVDQVLEKLEAVLVDLVSVADDIECPEDLQTLKANIEFAKRYYERGERLLLNQRELEYKGGI